GDQPLDGLELGNGLVDASETEREETQAGVHEAQAAVDAFGLGDRERRADGGRGADGVAASVLEAARRGEPRPRGEREAEPRRLPGVAGDVDRLERGGGGRGPGGQ